ncbi:MAG: polyprenyl synthetase family protein [Desulfovibrio sp.]|nr:polyprenyl synthetase family protein [Desulfovibrio sp.]
MMPQDEMKVLLRSRGHDVEKFLSSCLDGRDMPPRLRQAMLYSLLAGGKRLRPVLCMSAAALCGLDPAQVLPFAAAIEMIHTYSLIHDDLPAMDNDDLRRGKPSNHRAFDEATAILAGDGLLTDAFLTMCSTSLPSERVLAAVAEIALAAGSSGMVGGQEWDMIHTGGPAIGLNQLRSMHAMKTGALLRASCVCGALLAGAHAELREAMSTYGVSLGVAFQIADDILDLISDTITLGKPVGSDVVHGKNTYPALVGLEKSRELASSYAREACAALDGHDGLEADFLRALADYTVQRTV